MQVDPECTRGLRPFGREGGRRRTRGPSGRTAQNQQLMALSGYASAHGGPEPGAPASAARGYSVILRGSDLSQKYRTTLRNFPEVCLLLPELLEMPSPGACRCGAGILQCGGGRPRLGDGHQPRLGAPPNPPGWWKPPLLSVTHLGKSQLSKHPLWDVQDMEVVPHGRCSGCHLPGGGAGGSMG